MKNFRSKLVGLMFGFILGTSVSFGCQTSPGEIPLCYIYQSTNTIFVGKVVKIETKKAEPAIPQLKPELKDVYTINYKQVTFAVTQNFKNASAPTLQVTTVAAVFSSCDTVYDFKLGERWVVFANPQNFIESKLYSSFAINLNEKKENKTLSGLTKIKEKGITSSIFGQFRINYPLSQINIKGYKVTVEADGNLFTSKMDEYGQFSFPNVASGTFSVRVYLPYEGYVLNDKRDQKQFIFDYDSNLYVYEFDAVVKEGECYYEVIKAFPPEPLKVPN